MFPAVDFRKWGRTLINDFHKVLIFPAKAEQKFWQKYSWYQKLPRSPSSLSSDKFDRIRVPCTLYKLSSSPASQPSSDKDQGPARVGFWSSRSEKWQQKTFTLLREVQSEKKCFHSFSRSAKWNQNVFTLFGEVKSEIKMLRDREVKILENS